MSVNVKNFFYEERHALTAKAASVVLKIVSAQFYFPESVLDVGCGVGTWMAVAKEMGAKRVKGIEGSWLEKIEKISVPRSEIITSDLETEWSNNECFDLSISLEVAEHLSPRAGDRLVSQVCKASPLVLFSAAVPGQGGNGHVNEQWPEYWQTRFASNRYRAIDCVRPQIWNETNIPWWYRQNIILFAHENKAREYFSRLAQLEANEDIPLLGLTHPIPHGKSQENDVAKRHGLIRKIKSRLLRNL